MTPEQRFAEKIIRDGSCLRWTAYLNAHGYGKFCYNGETCYAHRVAWEWANGPITDGLCCCHTCDHPWCVEPTHLWLGTQADNMRDMADKGRSRVPIGQDHGDSKVTDNDVRAIRKAAETGESGVSIGRRYPISDVMISRIIRRKNWTHVS